MKGKNAKKKQVVNCAYYGETQIYLYMHINVSLFKGKWGKKSRKKQTKLLPVSEYL